MATYEDGLAALGFELTGESRRGGRMWTLPFNHHLKFTLHDYDDAVVLTWSFALGEYVAQRGWMLGSGDLSTHDLYPVNDVKLPIEIEALEAELRRTLTTLRLDLGDPNL